MNSVIIPHGVDTNIYRPLPLHVKNTLKEQQGWKDKFVVGSIARNQSRKLLPLTMRAFAEFARDKPEAILLLHCDPRDPQGNNLHDMAKRLKIEDKIHYGMKRFDFGVPDQRVNLEYNCMDIHVLGSTGEGFGIPVIESMASGVPNIATDYTSMQELLQGRGELVRVAGMIPGQYNTNRALADIDDFVAKMNKLYYDSKLREGHALRAREFALKHFNWEKVCRMWIQLFDYGEILEKYVADKDVEEC